MPISYNTNTPTPTTKNTINSVTLGTFTGFNIRDFLLNKCLLPQYPYISTAINGSPKVGEPVLDTQIGTGSNSIPIGLPLETIGITRYNTAISTNKFKNIASTATDLTTVNYVQSIQAPWQNTTFPNGVDSYPIGANTDIDSYGLLAKSEAVGYRKSSTLMNLYLDDTKQIDVSSWINLIPLLTTQQIKGYADTYGGLNLGSSDSIQAADVIGSVLNGQGLGLAKGGVVTNFDLRSSLAGRVLSATGTINDTKLGMIGGQQLALALANNAAFNVEQDLLGTLNAQDNVLSLVKNGTLAGFRPNYQITVASSALGKVADYTARILGFTLPKSYLSDAGSIFLSESNSANIERANAMILNTGKGQVKALIANMSANLIGTTQHDNPDLTAFRSGYVPGFKDNRGNKAINPNLYAFYTGEGAIISNLLNGSGVIPELSYNRTEKINEYGFNGFEESGVIGDSYVGSNIKNPTFTWGTSEGAKVNSLSDYQFATHDKKTLLGKTQKLFDTIGMKTIVSTKGQMNVTPSQIQTAVVGYGISKGNAVMSSGNFDSAGRYNGTSAGTADNIYCRSWTTLSRYDSLDKLVRASGLYDKVPYRRQTHGSVLDDNGHPIIAPYYDSNNTNGAPADPKRFMLSIENLAWSDSLQNLLQSEIGSGDLLSGKKGRIMWFPPYDINFTENATANWETNNFIGRGEPIYTYNNTERSGTLSFKIIVDHPTYFNSFKGSKGPDDHYIASYFAGCISPDDKIASKLTISELDSLSRDYTKPQQKVDTPQTPPETNNIYVYFPNDVSDVTKYINYENGSPSLPNGIGAVVGEVTHPGKTINDTTNFGLNQNILYIDNVAHDGFYDANFLSDLNTYLNDKCSKCKVTVTGYASPQGKAASNTTLATNRANTILNYIKPQLHTNLNGNDKNSRFEAKGGGVVSSYPCLGNDDASASASTSTSTIGCKKDRYAVINITYVPTLLPNTSEPEPVTQTSQQKSVNTKITNRFYDERNFFEKLQVTDAFVFDKVREKIKYFHPAFHSTTPEGLNSRLTFLHQCTRQGPTLEAQGANNLAFGRAPVCILRVGDFYNTKIIIDNIGVDYEPLVWDLNPEGIGVQPMIANVNISFKFIGGSTLMGPINKLQNALSFNYYANTQVYDVRADYIAKNPLENTLVVNPLAPYVLSNDFNPLTYGTTLETSTMTQAEMDANTPIIDQSKANNNATTGPLTIPPTNELDNVSIVANYSISVLKKNNSINGTTTLTLSTSNALSSDYAINVNLYDKLNSPINIGVGTFASTNTTKTYTFPINSSTFVSDTSMRNYQAEVSIGIKKLYYNLTF